MKGGLLQRPGNVLYTVLLKGNLGLFRDVGLEIPAPLRVLWKLLFLGIDTPPLEPPGISPSE